MVGVKVTPSVTLSNDTTQYFLVECEFWQIHC